MLLFSCLSVEYQFSAITNPLRVWGSQPTQWALHHPPFFFSHTAPCEAKEQTSFYHSHLPWLATLIHSRLSNVVSFPRGELQWCTNSVAPARILNVTILNMCMHIWVTCMSVTILNMCMHMWIAFTNLQFCQGSIRISLLLEINCQGIFNVSNMHRGLRAYCPCLGRLGVQSTSPGSADATWGPALWICHH